MPSLIYQDLNLGQRVLRDMATEESVRILVDSRETYQKILDFAQQYTQTIVERIQHYPDAVGAPPEAAARHLF